MDPSDDPIEAESEAVAGAVGEAAAPLPPPRANPSRRTLVLLVAPIIVFVIGGYVANATWATLLREHPLWLIVLDPRNRWLILVSQKVDTVPFFVVGFLRRVATDPMFFALGYLYGDRAVRWVERRFAPDTGMVPWLEKNFPKFGPLLVLISPGALVCVLAGAMGMNPILFAVMNVAGTVGILTLLLIFGEAFSGPVGVLTDFLSRNFRVITAISIIATAYLIWDQRRKGKSELTSLTEAEREIEGET